MLGPQIIMFMFISFLKHNVYVKYLLIYLVAICPVHFQKGFETFPTFNRLKFLGLDENWCVPDEHPLACILEHSPVLEELILCLYFKVNNF